MANIVEPIARIRDSKGETVEIPMMQRTPVRIGRRYKEKLPPDVPC
jgi:V/A-type H+-transporting ATPase subunit A